MATSTGTIVEIRLEPEGMSGKIACPPVMRPNPGQYLLASSPDPCEPLPVVLFPSAVEVDGFWISTSLPANWSTGMQFNLRGPLGKGFRMPPATRRLALASLDGSPARLLPLAHQALERNAAVVLYANQTPTGLPADVEVLPLDLLPEAPTWADFLALDIRVRSLPDLRSRLGLLPHQNPACSTQVLVIAPMPCTGLAECGVCAVPVRDGWALACSDGPVFEFNTLEGRS